MIVIDAEQRSYEWLLARLGIPTASRFDEIITPKTMKLSASANRYMHELLAEWLLGEPLDSASSQFMQRGSEMESKAIAWYEFTYDVEVRRVGFCKTDDGLCGCSPDGLIGDDGGIEIKILSAREHVAALLDTNQLEHRGQIQGGMFAAERKWWDRLYWHPTLPKFVLRIDRDDDYIGQLSIALADFHVRLSEAKEVLLAKGARPRPVQARQEYCEYREPRDPCLDGWVDQEEADRLCDKYGIRRRDGRMCMSKVGLRRVGDRWLCSVHAEAINAHR